jgi:hypothetical protein
MANECCLEVTSVVRGMWVLEASVNYSRLGGTDAKEDENSSLEAVVISGEQNISALEAAGATDQPYSISMQGPEVKTQHMKLQTLERKINRVNALLIEIRLAKTYVSPL